MKIVLMVLCFASSHILYSQIIEDCSKCQSDLIRNNQLKGKTLEELQLLRNEILARKGYVFSSEIYAKYFENQS